MSEKLIQRKYRYPPLIRCNGDRKWKSLGSFVPSEKVQRASSRHFSRNGKSQATGGSASRKWMTHCSRVMSEAALCKIKAAHSDA